eukprot:166477-Rhodomonas_salina.1
MISAANKHTVSPASPLEHPTMKSAPQHPPVEVVIKQTGANASSTPVTNGRNGIHVITGATQASQHFQTSLMIYYLSIRPSCYSVLTA